MCVIVAPQGWISGIVVRILVITHLVLGYLCLTHVDMSIACCSIYRTFCTSLFPIKMKPAHHVQMTEGSRHIHGIDCGALLSVVEKDDHVEVSVSGSQHHSLLSEFLRNELRNIHVAISCGQVSVRVVAGTYPLLEIAYHAIKVINCFLEEYENLPRCNRRRSGDSLLLREPLRFGLSS